MMTLIILNKNNPKKYPKGKVNFSYDSIDPPKKLQHKKNSLNLIQILFVSKVGVEPTIS